MSLKLEYYGQNDGTTVPDVLLTGDPAVDQPVLVAAGYLGGKIMALKTSLTSGRGVVVTPCDASQTGTGVKGDVPYGVLINGAGEYATSIGPSGSKKTPVVRAMWKGIVDSEAYVTGDTFVVGAPVYCGGGANKGKYSVAAATAVVSSTPYTDLVGICTHIPTTAEPWLGVASLI